MLRVGCRCSRCRCTPRQCRPSLGHWELGHQCGSSAVPTCHEAPIPIFVRLLSRSSCRPRSRPPPPFPPPSTDAGAVKRRSQHPSLLSRLVTTRCRRRRCSPQLVPVAGGWRWSSTVPKRGSCQPSDWQFAPLRIPTGDGGHGDSGHTDTDAESWLFVLFTFDFLAVSSSPSPPPHHLSNLASLAPQPPGSTFFRHQCVSCRSLSL